MKIDILYIFLHYISSLTVAMAFLPLVSKVFNKTHLNGYFSAKTLGYLIISYVVWIISSFKLVPYNITLIIVVLLCFVVINYFFIKPDKIKYKQIVTSEAIYLTLFILFVLYRAGNPDIKDIEKFMDFGILNGIGRTNYFPPQDIWYAGNSINYYYFGHLVHSVIQKFSFVPTPISYNLSISFIFTNAFLLTYWIINTLTQKKIYAVLGATLLTLGGNLDFMYKVLILSKSTYFYAEARSLIEYTINEFPAYSFIISDLHAHIINIPFVLLFIALLIELFKLKKHNYLLYGSITLVLGSLFAINSWDFLIYGALLGILMVCKFIKTMNNKNIIALVIIAICSYVLFLPFYLNFHPAVSGIGFVTNQSDIKSVIIMFGFLLLINSLLFIPLIKKVKNGNKILIYIMALFGLFLILVPEVIYLKDIYDSANPPYYRANTVFKVWYQAWIILSITGTYGIYIFYETIKNKVVMYSMSVLLFFLFTWVFSYIPNAMQYIFGNSYTYKGLDGQAYLETVDPERYKAAVWLNENVYGQPVILEAEGESYKIDSVTSSFTGLPTVVGWRDHEFGWRNNWPELSKRLDEIKTIYTDNNMQEVKALIKKHEIKYIVLGNAEKSKYGEKAGEELIKIYSEIFRAESLVILETDT